MDGSAKIALELENSFYKYIFIEINSKKAEKLNELKKQYKKNIEIIVGDSNTELINLCNKIDWPNYRAVLFLDPFGMQIKWETLEFISKHSLIDLWLLFPISTVNRLLKKNGKIDSANENKLNIFFGNDDWKKEFYKKSSQMNLFEKYNDSTKIADFNKIAKYTSDKLNTIFSAVAKNHHILYNSKNSALFAFYFAISNNSEKAKKVSLNIANYILDKI